MGDKDRPEAKPAKVERLSIDGLDDDLRQIRERLDRIEDALDRMGAWNE